MNIVVLIDTSLSMGQIFDKRLSLIDSIKAAVERLFLKRENENKIDKLFLISTSYDNNMDSNILSNWEHPTQHFYFQLKLLKPSFQKSNIINGILESFKLLNKYNFIPNDKIIYGRLPSKLEQSIVILFTDGESSFHDNKLISRNYNIKNLNIPKDENSSFPFNTSFINLEQSLYTIILNKSSNKDYDDIHRINNYIGGKTFYCESYDELISLMDEVNYNISLEKCNINLELGNKEVNKTQLKEGKYMFNQNNSYINLSLTTQLSRELFKHKRIIEKWPFPTCFSLNKSIVSPIINSKLLNYYPSYIVGSNIKLYPSNFSNGIFDEYEILSKSFITNILFSYEDLLITETRALYWEVFNSIQEHNEIDSKVKSSLKLFGIIKLSIPLSEKKKISDLQNSNIIPSFHDYITKHDGVVKLKLCVGPIDYNDFLEIITKIETRSQTESILLMTKYLDNIPNYYLNYIQKYLDSLNIQLFNSLISSKNNFEERFVNSQLLKTIESLEIKQNSIIIEIIKDIEKNKLSHFKNLSNCCNLEAFKPKSKRENRITTRLSDYIRNHKSKIDHVMIQNMGNFKPKMDFEMKNALRDWRDESNNKNCYINFGNPFRTMKDNIKNDIDFGSHINTYQNDVDYIIKEESIHPNRNKKQLRSKSCNSKDTSSNNSKSTNEFEYLADSAELKLTNDVEELKSIKEIKVVKELDISDCSLSEFKKQFEAKNDSNSYIRVATKYHLNSERLLKNKLLQSLTNYTRNLLSNRHDIKKINVIITELCNLNSISKPQLISYLVNIKENMIKLGFESAIIRLIEKQVELKKA